MSEFSDAVTEMRRGLWALRLEVPWLVAADMEARFDRVLAAMPTPDVDEVLP